ncbi:hypothetical protein [Microbacterium sp. Marseille-Q6648]|uniref:hypothetical protein n=1 Tax=Microbacterium sp. Marseille-Q6648 TaxID=2937991 RepID=UPI00203AE751|nr:hypothetical protein [Microbacterium sp. Marseille-Q6648]
MISAARTQDAVILSERLLITRIITSVALALLLIVGAWMATHTEPEAAAPTASSVTEHVDAHIAPIAAGAPVIDQGTTSPTLLGVAACVLGVLCGLLLIVATRWVHRTRRPQPERGLLPLLRALLPAPAPPRAAAFSLTQLSISRT